ncbi:hypothetical protein OE88DRAFT_332780 [Heliocybe sulcata]|uniref:BTB domain-containing protein n=1 Tax=Heliocybe sulcata TaxID=5364 RepID=A0A5C3MZK3_9AGAM|nr:hypothetical protein OE88DRAFT_332780 [Heliocybe sulcata]
MQEQSTEELIQRLLPTLLRELSNTAPSGPGSSAFAGYTTAPRSNLSTPPLLSAPLSRSPSAVSSISISPTAEYRPRSPPGHWRCAGNVNAPAYPPMYDIQPPVAPPSRTPPPVTIVFASDPSRSPSPLTPKDEGPEPPTGSPLAVSIATEHDRYFFADGTVTFMVEETLFRVHRFFFERDSALFRDQLFMHPQEHLGQPVVELKDCTVLDFERFLGVLYPNDFDQHMATTLEEWTSILALATRWSFESIRRLAVGKVFPLASPIDKVVLGHKYEIADWLGGAYVDICVRQDPVSDDEAEQLGAKEVARISRVRERILREQLATSDPLAMRKLVGKEFQLQEEITDGFEVSEESRQPEEDTSDATAQEQTSRGEELDQTEPAVVGGTEDDVQTGHAGEEEDCALFGGGPGLSAALLPGSTCELLPADEADAKDSERKDEYPVPSTTTPGTSPSFLRGGWGSNSASNGFCPVIPGSIELKPGRRLDAVGL